MLGVEGQNVLEHPMHPALVRELQLVIVCGVAGIPGDPAQKISVMWMEYSPGQDQNSKQKQ